MDDGIDIRDRILKRMRAQRKEEDRRLIERISREAEKEKQRAVAEAVAKADKEKDLAILAMWKDLIFSLYHICFSHDVPEEVQKIVDQAQPKDMPALRAISDYLSGHKGNEEEFKRFAKTSLAYIN